MYLSTNQPMNRDIVNLPSLPGIYIDPSTDLSPLSLVDYERTSVISTTKIYKNQSLTKNSPKTGQDINKKFIIYSKTDTLLLLQKSEIKNCYFFYFFEEENPLNLATHTGC